MITQHKFEKALGINYTILNMQIPTILLLYLKWHEYQLFTSWIGLLFIEDNIIIILFYELLVIDNH